MSPDPSMAESVTLKAELSPWNLSLGPAGPPCLAFIQLIPGRGERDMFTQPVLTVWIVRLLFPGARCCPEPASPSGGSLGKNGRKTFPPKRALGSCKVAAARLWGVGGVGRRLHLAETVLS